MGRGGLSEEDTGVAAKSFMAFACTSGVILLRTPAISSEDKWRSSPLTAQLVPEGTTHPHRGDSSRVLGGRVDAFSRSTVLFIIPGRFSPEGLCLSIDKFTQHVR